MNGSPSLRNRLSLAVRDIPRSGKPEDLLDRFGISARHVVDAVRSMIA